MYIKSITLLLEPSLLQIKQPHSLKHWNISCNHSQLLLRCRFWIHIYSTIRSNIVVIYVWLWELMVDTAYPKNLCINFPRMLCILENGALQRVTYLCIHVASPCFRSHMVFLWKSGWLCGLDESVWLFSCSQRASMLTGSSLGNSVERALGTCNTCHRQYNSNWHLFSFRVDHGGSTMMNFIAVVSVLSFVGLPTMMCPMLPRLSYVYIDILRKSLFFPTHFPP